MDIKNTRWVEIDNFDDLDMADEEFSSKEKILNYNNYLFDMDGVLYLGDRQIDGSKEVLNKLLERKKNIFFISNNSSKNKNEYVTKLKKMGINVQEKQIILSTDFLIEYLIENHVKSVFVLGTESLSQQIISAGINLNRHNPDFVVIGYDTELTYEKLKIACKLINLNVDYLATHCDLVCPTEDGPIPDIGSLINILKTTTNRSPYKIFGKPNVDFVNYILNKYKLDKANTVIIGDRLYTDIDMAHNSSIDSVLMLSGDTSREDLESSSLRPNYVLNNISRILP